MQQFRDFFTYEKEEKHAEGNTMFVNCVLLKDIGDQKKGDKVDVISIGVELFLWNGDKLIEDSYEYV